MPSIEWYLEHAYEFAQKFEEDWWRNVKAGNADSLSDDSRDVVEKACRYQEAKKITDALRESGVLTEPYIAAERAARQTFCEAYKAFQEKHQAAA